MSDRFYRVAGDDQAVSPDWTRASAKEMAACVADTSPSRARLVALAASPAFLTLDEYLEMFDGAISVDVEGEAVWPYQATLDYDALVE